MRRAFVEIFRLSVTDAALARETFALMGEVFDEGPWEVLPDAYLRRLLGSESVRVYAAVDDGSPVGGMTAHVLPMTRTAESEVLIYDLAVHPDRQREGIGHALVRRLREDAAAEGLGDVWVPADDDDGHALEFYRRIGGEPQAVTIFTFARG